MDIRLDDSDAKQWLAFIDLTGQLLDAIPEAYYGAVINALHLVTKQQRIHHIELEKAIHVWLAAAYKNHEKQPWVQPSQWVSDYVCFIGRKTLMQMIEELYAQSCLYLGAGRADRVVIHAVAHTKQKYGSELVENLI